jgi:hypothetical protein
VSDFGTETEGGDTEVTEEGGGNAKSFLVLFLPSTFAKVSEEKN